MKPEVLQKCPRVQQFGSVCIGLPSFTYVMENTKSYKMSSYGEMKPPGIKGSHLASKYPFWLYCSCCLIPHSVEIFSPKKKKAKLYLDLSANLDEVE